MRLLGRILARVPSASSADTRHAARVPRPGPARRHAAALVAGDGRRCRALRRARRARQPPDATPYTANSQILVARSPASCPSCAPRASRRRPTRTSRQPAGPGRRPQGLADAADRRPARAEHHGRGRTRSPACSGQRRRARARRGRAASQPIAAQVVRQTRAQRTPVQIRPREASANPAKVTRPRPRSSRSSDFVEPGRPLPDDGAPRRRSPGSPGSPGHPGRLALGLVVDIRRRRVETLDELDGRLPRPRHRALRHGRGSTATAAALARVREGVLVADAGRGGAAALSLALAGGRQPGRPASCSSTPTRAPSSPSICGLTGRDVVPDGATPTQPAAARRRARPGPAGRAAAGAAARPRPRRRRRPAGQRSRVPPGGGQPRPAEAVISAPARRPVPDLGSLVDGCTGAVLAVRPGPDGRPEVVDAVTVLERHG